MSHILISGLVNIETTVPVRQFPVQYYPIDYPFFGVHSAVSGVAYNLALTMKTLGDEVRLLSMTGADFPAAYIRQTLRDAGIDSAGIRESLRETPGSVVLYDGAGKRQIYCDLKDIQQTPYDFPPDVLDGIDLVAACNTNFNRPLLRLAKEAGIPIATDVHVLSQVWDDYNRDFMEQADILFLSDEGIGDDYRPFLWEMARAYGTEILVLGRGGKGAAMYLKEQNRIYELPAVQMGGVVNTVGAGDALFSAFVHFYAKGLAPLDALARAQLFAAAKIRVNGASAGFVTEEEMDNIWNSLSG